MKKIYQLALTVSIASILLFCTNPLQAQEGYYMHLDYIKIEKANLSDFMDNVESTFKPIQEARVDNGYIDSWYLYRVAYRGTQNASYNYVVVSLSDRLSGFEDITKQLEGHFSDSDSEAFISDYNRYLSPNHSELWSINNSVLLDESSKPSRYFGMDFMQVRSGQEYAYQMMEDEVARPLHETRMENGTMKGWELFSIVTPGGTEYGYNFATGNYYQNLRDIEFGFTDEIIRANHPGTNINEFFEEIENTRDLVRSDLWELVDYVK